MSFKVIYGDATTYKGDAILNSLGTNGAVYGRLCKNVIEKINRPAVKKLIDEQVNMAVGTIIETEGGDMNCEHVIHIVTPFRKDEVSVSGNKKLIAAYQSVVDYAIKKGYKSIGLPFIGTGANGYSESEAYDALIDVASRISDREVAEKVDILDITILGYLKKTSYGERRPLNGRRNYREVGDPEAECIRLGVPAYFSTFKYMTKSSAGKVLKGHGYNDAAINAISDENSPFWIVKFMSDLDPNKFFKPDYKKFSGRKDGPYNYPYDFIRDYCAQNGIN
ncbi:MAG: macro domain-containing protein, partial [Clostridia bacterium]|nr:macro domain-containing protein [Clostridia bacterium]